MAKAKDSSYHRVVVKFGTGLLTGGSDHLNLEIMSNLVTQVAQLHKQGLELIVVSSGAIASGKYKLGLTRKIRGIPYRQVLALRKQKRSLLAAGIKQVEGDFQRGDIVNIYDPQGSHLGCGISNYSSRDITTVKGAHSGKIADILGYDYGSEVVHRNNLVIL